MPHRLFRDRRDAGQVLAGHLRSAEHLRLRRLWQDRPGGNRRGYTAFHDGLHVALCLSVGLVLAASLLAFITLRSRPAGGIFTVLPRSSDRDDGQP
jgi:hypothetical protein